MTDPVADRLLRLANGDLSRVNDAVRLVTGDDKTKVLLRDVAFVLWSTMKELRADLGRNNCPMMGATKEDAL
jgi:hypothetical protein